MTDEQQIRDLIERWAAAVHEGDLAVVLADHAPGIVMFDVPPPEQGVRGIEAYRQPWPGFFEWQASGAMFEIESLDVTAGPDVAFAFALLKCGKPGTFAPPPGAALRPHRRPPQACPRGARPPRAPLLRRRAGAIRRAF